MLNNACSTSGDGLAAAGESLPHATDTIGNDTRALDMALCYASLGRLFAAYHTHHLAVVWTVSGFPHTNLQIHVTSRIAQLIILVLNTDL